MKKYLLAIPIYNEESNLENVLGNLFNYINPKCFDVLAIDDGSTDHSLDKLRKFPEVKFIKNDQNFGYGYSIQTAFEYARKWRYEFLITMDADGQHLPQVISDFLNHEEDADIVSGSRYMKATINTQNIIKTRFRINQKITRLLNQITGYGLTDSFCGMKLYRVDKLKFFHTSDHYYSMPLQVIVQAWNKHLSWTEIPVPLIYIDNQRNFNNLYENDKARLAYYLKTIKNEMEKLGYEKSIDFWSSS